MVLKSSEVRIDRLVLVAPWGAQTVVQAALHDHFACFKYAIKNGCNFNDATFHAAARSGSIQCLQYLLDNSPARPDLGESAVAEDNLTVMKFAHQNKLICWSKSLCEAASVHGSINCLKYAREQNCPWSPSVANRAGNLACLQYALQNGCPYNAARVCANAVELGDFAMLKFAVEFGCRWDLATLCKSAVVNDIDMLRYIYNTSQRRWPRGVRSTNRKVLHYMVRHKCKFTI